MTLERYIEVVRDVVGGVLSMGSQLTLPLALLLGMVLVAATVAWALARREGSVAAQEWRRWASEGLGYVAIALVLVTGLSALRATRFVAQNELRRRDRAQATSNPVPDAPPVLQSGPAVAILREREYSSTLTLPPSFLKGLDSEGLSVLAPYLSEPTASNVVRMRDSFRRSGRRVVFTRQSTVQEEEPIPLSDSRVKVVLSRLAGRAYDASFEASYAFKNSSPKPVTAHFLFSLPQAGTVRDLSIRVGQQELGTAAEPQEGQEDEASGASNAAYAGNAAPSPSELAAGEESGTGAVARVVAGDPNTYEWKGVLAPGEERQALVSYRVTGARVWSYDLGSTRRRVEKFQLDADTGGGVRFARGSLQPTEARGSELSWQLSNVITAQQLSLVLPSDKEGDQLYLQALTSLPVCLVLFGCSVLALASWTREPLSPLRLGVALGAFAFGLGASTIAATYSVPLVALLAAPLAGALAASAALGRRFLLVVVPVALLPATFLSPHHTGLLVLLLGTVTAGALALAWKKRWVL